MTRRRRKTANLSLLQANRIEAAVAAGYARNRDEFVRFWAEFGLVAIGLMELRPHLVKALLLSKEDTETTGRVSLRNAKGKEVE